MQGTSGTTDTTRKSTRYGAWLLVGLGTVVLLTRLPWISAGYGADPDAYRVVNAARHFVRTGDYVASRLPGYPVYEYLTALTTVSTSPVLSNGLTAVFSSVAAVFFALTLRFFEIKHDLLLSLAFSLTPTIYVNSTATMDYMVALAFMLGSTYFVLVRRPLVAGLLLGLAIGSRITSGALLLPLSLWILQEEKGRLGFKKTARLWAAALALGGLCFLPVVHRYGYGFFTFHDVSGYPGMAYLVRRGIVNVWGKPAVLGFLGLVLLAPLTVGDLKGGLRRPRFRHGLMLCATLVVLYSAAFLRLPQESAYLIPAVPFILLFTGLVFRSRFVGYLCVAIMLSSFVTIGGRGLAFSGPIVNDHRIRETRIGDTQAVLAATAQLPGNAVVVAGWRLPQIREALDRSGRVDRRFVYLIKDEESYQRLVSQGRQVYFLPGMAVYNLRTRGFDLRKLGARPLWEPPAASSPVPVTPSARVTPEPRPGP